MKLVTFLSLYSIGNTLHYTKCSELCMANTQALFVTHSMYNTLPHMFLLWNGFLRERHKECFPCMCC